MLADSKTSDLSTFESILAFQPIMKVVRNVDLHCREGNSQNNIDDKGYWDSGCSRHMTDNISYLSDYEPFDKGYVSFGQGGCKITDDTNVLLRTPRQHNMYSIDLNNVVPHKDLTCLVAKASADECMLWHRRLGHLKIKTMNRDRESKGPEGTTSTNFSGTKEAASQDVKKDVSSLRYIAFPNWFHEVHLESSTSNAQDACNADAPESSGNSNPTVTSTNPSADHIETLAVETPIPTVSSLVSTACLNDSPELLSDTRLISKRVTSQDDTPSLDNILTLTNRFEDILGVTTNTDDLTGVEADLGNMEYNISASPTPTFRIHKDHPKSQIIGPMDTLPLGFQDPEFPARVYKVEKAMGKINQTLFIRRQRGDFVLVQVYVDDIFFGSSNPQLCRELEALMHEKFQMSAMGELNFFLGLQVLQKKDGIFLSQDKYVGDILKKFGYSDVRSANTPMDKENP
nr:hypothetical protein [Tanacetum cinerariifolium]